MPSRRENVEQSASLRPRARPALRRLPQAGGAGGHGGRAQHLRALPASVTDALAFFADIELSDTQALIAARIIQEVRAWLRLDDVGVGYLLASRRRDLSGGEAQRIRLATQIGSGPSGCSTSSTSPPSALHQVDNRKLIGTPGAAPRPGQLRCWSSSTTRR